VYAGRLPPSLSLVAIFFYCRRSDQKMCQRKRGVMEWRPGELLQYKHVKLEWGGAGVGGRTEEEEGRGWGGDDVNPHYGFSPMGPWKASGERVEEQKHTHSGFICICVCVCVCVCEWVCEGVMGCCCSHCRSTHRSSVSLVQSTGNTQVTEWTGIYRPHGVTSA